MRTYAKRSEANARSHKRKKPPKSGSQAAAYLPDEVAELTGLNVNSIYKGARNGTIPALRVGKRWIFPKAAIDRWLENAGRESSNKQQNGVPLS